MSPSASASEEPAFTTQSRIGAPPRWLRNRGVESPQSKGDSPWMSTRHTLQPPSSTAWVTRSPSSPGISMPPPLACWISSATLTPAPAGATAFAPAPSGSPGASVSTSARHARRCAWRVRSPRCHGWPRHSRAASCRTPRSARSRGWRRRRPKSACWRSGVPAPPSMSSASSAAGDAWIARRSETKPTGSTPTAPSTCIQPKTVP